MGSVCGDFEAGYHDQVVVVGCCVLDACEGVVVGYCVAVEVLFSEASGDVFGGIVGVW